MKMVTRYLMGNKGYQFRQRHIQKITDFEAKVEEVRKNR